MCTYFDTMRQQWKIVGNVQCCIVASLFTFWRSNKSAQREKFFFVQKKLENKFQQAIKRCDGKKGNAHARALAQKR